MILQVELETAPGKHIPELNKVSNFVHSPHFQDQTKNGLGKIYVAFGLPG